MEKKPFGDTRARSLQFVAKETLASRMGWLVKDKDATFALDPNLRYSLYN